MSDSKSTTQDQTIDWGKFFERDGVRSATYGGIGGIGGYFLKLTNNPTKKEETEKKSSENTTGITDTTANIGNIYPQSIPGLPSLLIFAFLGAIAGFIATTYNLGTTGYGTDDDDKKNRHIHKERKLKAAASAMLFGLFFPTTFNLLHSSSFAEGQVKSQSQFIKQQNIKIQEQEEESSQKQTQITLANYKEQYTKAENEKSKDVVIGSIHSFIDSASIKDLNSEALNDLQVFFTNESRIATENDKSEDNLTNSIDDLLKLIDAKSKLIVGPESAEDKSTEDESAEDKSAEDKSA